MMKQNTIQNEFSFSGKGLHTGLMINARFLPAEEGFGIQICRVDLPSRPTHRALAEYVTETSRGTVLTYDEWRVSTVEHALSALYAMGIDNCLIEVDAPEMPILDGSAKYYVEAIERVGIKHQDAPCEELEIVQTIEYENERTGTKIVVEPAERLSLEVTIDFQSKVLSSSTAVLSSLDDYALEIAPARTFCFVREVEPLLKLGYIKGGDLKNAIVIYDEQMSQDAFDGMVKALGQDLQRDASELGYLTPLQLPNEPARHKLLDLIGDLSLVGKRIKGHVKAYRPGHTSNTNLAKQLRTL